MTTTNLKDALTEAFNARGFDAPPRYRMLANRVANLPDWPGADHVYSYLYKVLEQLGAENWKAEVKRAKKRRVKPKPPRLTSDMETIMDALGKGDEEQLKALQMKYKLR